MVFGHRTKYVATSTLDLVRKQAASQEGRSHRSRELQPAALTAQVLGKHHHQPDECFQNEYLRRLARLRVVREGGFEGASTQFGDVSLPLLL